ncbi:hypothetical protein ACSTIB_23325, partial [Vibrio parahaemolyticus]
RLFILTQPALMSIGWFAWGYERVTPWKEAITEQVRNSYVWRAGRALKWRARRALQPYWLALKPDVMSLARRAIDWAREVARRRKPQA